MYWLTDKGKTGPISNSNKESRKQKRSLWMMVKFHHCWSLYAWPWADQPTWYIGLTCSWIDVELGGKFCSFPYIIMPFFHTEPSKPESRLPTTSMLFRKINSELVEHLPGITTQCPKKSAIPIHYNEPKFVVWLQEFIQCLCVEFIVTQVKGCIYRLEWLKINRHLQLHGTNIWCYLQYQRTFSTQKRYGQKQIQKQGLNI